MTSETQFIPKEKHLYVYLISLVAAVGGFLFGYDISIISGAAIFMKQEFNLSGASLGFLMSSAQIGCIFGAMLGGTICDLFREEKGIILLIHIIRHIDNFHSLRSFNRSFQCF